MYVFAYGTLLETDRADAVLGPDGYDVVARATLDGCRRVDGEYPTLAPGGSVEGHLLEVDEAGLGALDSYEGVDRGLYVRVAIPLARANDSDEEGVRCEEDDDDDAWVYVGAPERLAVDERVAWPADGCFDERVRAAIAGRQIVIRPHE